MMTVIDAMLLNVNTLKKLLDDPYPGLITWQTAVSDAVLIIYELKFGKKREKRT